MTPTAAPPSLPARLLARVRRGAPPPLRPLFGRPPSAAAVLCYHSIEEEGRSPYSLPPRALEEHLRFLKDRYRIVTAAEAAESVRLGRGFGEPAAAVTFDDGRRDSLETALPILERLAVPATFFVSSGLAGQGYRSYLDWEGLRSLAASAGAELGSHGRLHLPMDSLDAPDLEREAAGSRRELAERAGAAADLFAYPFGIHTPAAVAAVRAAGYRGAFLAGRGGDGPFRIGRVVLTGSHAGTRALEWELSCAAWEAA